MTGQQLDLFGGPLRPPKKILEDEQPVEKIQADTPAQNEEPPAELPGEEAEELAPDAETPDMAARPIDPEALATEDEFATGEEETTVARPVDAEETTAEISVEEEDDADEPAAAMTAEINSSDEGDVDEAEVSSEETESEAIEEEEEEENNEAIEDGETTGEEAPEDEEATEDDQDEEDEQPVEAEEIQLNQKAGNKSPAEGNGPAILRGRKSSDPEEELEMLNVPPDEDLFKRQYYSMRETAAMFNVNQSLLRFWENEFDILQPKKNKKGDRYFRPIDVKNLVLIYHLLRVRKFTMEGAKEYLNTHQKAGDSFQLVQRLEKLKSFLLELKANL